MKLYNVIAPDCEGDSHGWDLFVRASNTTDAIRHWQQYYQTSEFPYRIDELPSHNGRSQAINWNDLLCVWINPRMKQMQRLQK